MKILYYDCFAGISGDMNLGALVDLGVDPDRLVAELEKLDIEGFRLEIRKDKRRGISGTKVDVVVDHPDNEKHRHLHHVEQIVNSSALSEKVKADALKIFGLVAEAEARVHDIPVEKVHFHEVGALDSIADIVGAAICIDLLGADRILSSPVQLGGGTVKCAHGVMPVPAPATALILENIPVKKGLTDHEATTPTGAAIVAAFAEQFTDTLGFRILKTGYGIGNRDTEVPNVLRVFLCEAENEKEDLETRENLLLSCNIDDMNPEHYEFVLERLFEAGAKDAWMIPVIMKKTRPAATLSVLCEADARPVIEEILIRHTSTLGFRSHPVTKKMVRREEELVSTLYGEVRIKKSFYEGQLLRVKPEAEDCRKIAREHGMSLAEVEKKILRSMEL